MELLRTTSRGTSVIDSAPQPLNLEDKKTHQLQWVRELDGRMRITVDGREVLAATDRGFLEKFNGLRMVNRGGDYIFKQLKVYGSK